MLNSCSKIQAYVDNGVVDCDTEYTQMLIDCITNGSFVLRAPSSRNYELAKNLSYLFQGSGIVSTLYKVKSVWGDQAVIDTLEYLAEYVDEWTPNDDCNRWLKVYTADYKKAHPDYMPFFRAAVV